MKAILTCLALSTATLLAQSPAPVPARELKQLLQDGLFEEEANRNLEKAAAAYEALLNGFEHQRQFAATALFRLAEVRAKQNRKDDAVALYQRVVAEFGKDNLAKLSRERLAALGSAAPAEGNPVIADKEAEEIARLQDLVKNSPDLLNAADQGITPLGKAAQEGWLNAAKYLLDRGADIGGRFGHPSLILAALKGRKAMVELLLDRGADVNGKDNLGDTALVAAVTASRPEVAKVLLDRGADPNTKNAQDHTPLHAACEKGDLEMVKLILPKISDVNVVSRAMPMGAPMVDSNDVAGTPLMIATRGGHLAVAKLLLERGASPDVEASPRKNALTTAVGTNNAELTALLLEHRADPNIPGLLGIAIGAQNEDIVRLLIKHRADLNLKDSQGITPLLVAIGRSVELAKILLEAGASTTSLNLNGDTPLHAALYYFEPVAARSAATFSRPRMISDGARLTQPLRVVGAPSRPASKDGGAYDPFAIMKLLVEKGADVNARGSRGRTVISAALANNSVPTEVLEWLLARGADPRLPNGPDPTTPGEPVKTAAELAGTMERRIWLEQRLTYPDWAKEQRISAVFRFAGSPVSPEPVLIKPAAEFDTQPTATEVIQVLARSLQDRTTNIATEFQMRVFRQAGQGKTQEVANVPVAVNSPSTLIDAKLPALQWGDVVVLFREENTRAFTRAEHLSSVQSSNVPPPRQISVQVGDRNSSIQLSSGRESGASLWSSAAEVLPGWRFSELITHVTAAEPRADLSAVKVRRKQADGKVSEWTVDLRPGTSDTAVRSLPARLADGDTVVIPLLPANDAVALQERKEGIFLASHGRLLGERIFALSENDDAPRTLSELITESYKVKGMLVPNPDFSRIKIHRLAHTDGAEETLTIDLAARMQQVSAKTSEGEARKLDVPLQPGDIVEIPVMEDSSTEDWSRFPGQARLFFGKALARAVTLAIPNGEEKKVGLVPAFRNYRNFKRGSEVYWDGTEEKSASFRVLPLVKPDANVLKVRIHSRGKTREYTSDALRSSNPWLVDGDVVEIERF